MNKSSYNPFDDDKLHLTVNKPDTNSLDERASYNDAIKHGDIVQGIQSPKRFEQLPKWYQNPRKIYATISVLVFFSFLIYQVIQIVIAITLGK
jgi:hypothetical protein